MAGRILWLVCLPWLLTFPSTVDARGAQSAEPGGSRRDRALQVARDIISASRYCTLVTVAADGQPQARIVDPLAPDGGLSVYIATNPLSRKVGEIRRNSRVTLLYFDAAKPGYVTLIGAAHEVAGPEKRTHHKPSWESFFPREKPETYTLLRFTPSRVEVVSAKDGLAGDVATWRPETIEIR